MSSNDSKSRDEVMAARQAKKQAKKGKLKDPAQSESKEQTPAQNADLRPVQNADVKETAPTVNKSKVEQGPSKVEPKTNSLKGKDEVDKAVKLDTSITDAGDKNKEQIKAERAAKKAAKQAKKKGAAEGDGLADKPAVKEVPKPVNKDTTVKEVPKPVNKDATEVPKPVNEDMTVKDVVETLRDIANVAKDMKEVTNKVMDLSGKKAEESNKSKSELKAERRAKQEAQRAAKQAALDKAAAAKPKVEVKAAPEKENARPKEEKAPKQKVSDKTKVKAVSSNRVNWFQHLYKEHDKESLKSIAINSNLHPAIVKLGVQLASRVVSGSNARCVALLDALKKMVRDYTLPAKTEFARGLESHLATSLDFLWAMRPPSASQTNAVKFFRYHLTQLPNNVDEFDAKKTLQEEIDRYIREQIEMAGEAISIAVRNKISDGDNILTYGCSSLIERILRDAWTAGLKFRTVVVGNRVQTSATQMLRRLVAHGLPCTYVDITALGFVMNKINKVILGAGGLLVNGSVLGAAGTAQVALAAREQNVPVLVACETHKFSQRVQTDAFVYNEIGDPDDLIDKSDENSPLKDWRSNPNLTPLNLTYDVTPPSLVTAVVTELAILPCTSAPVVLRFKLSEYGV
ncbi:translation initiation factor eIF-2B subunit delta isoform X1 [Helicoverpa zea]|uniref:translation initiation factor eIF-2B subunit delta isoform X1 n=1 Tax=Helicoverpa zea TaxID=7113 RepID=UPI001F56CCCE|nr:translation initiation factor eIF-2B subunit delta isoform X1 [Helicoverpa zea]